MYPVLCGVIGTLSIIAAALFLRSYLRTRDGLFAMFAMAFPILGITEFVLGVLDTPELNQPRAYLPRLVAFMIILLAVVDKNRKEAKRTQERGKVIELRPGPQRRRAAR
jgi:uncharacterized membrane protein HdeD (DUF308 family)